MTPTIGSIVANKFRLVRELGRGSMGAVWLADHLTLDVRCAVKFMTSDASRDPNFLSRFEFEARAVAQLQSPYVVRVLDYAVDDDMPFIAMEFLQGEDLCARLSRVGRLDTQTTYRIVSQIARGLLKAHLAGVVHRDLKPENIFLSQEDDGEIAKLLDFGVAKSTAYAVHGTATQAGSLLGTPAYMSPEQVRSLREVDHRSDLWSLAVITYQCLTGKLPFDGPTLGDLFALIMYEPIPVPSEVAPWLPADFDAWWAKGAARRVEDRFANGRELASALGEALGITGAAEGYESWRNGALRSSPPEPLASQPPTQPPAGEDSRMTSTQAPLILSLRARQLIGLPRARYVAACTGAAAIAFFIAVFGNQAQSHPSVAHAANAPPRVMASPPDPTASPTPSSAILMPVELPALAPSRLPTATVTLSQIDTAAGDPAAVAVRARKSGASAVEEAAARPAVRAPVASRPVPHKTSRPATKSAADDVDFGI